MIAEAKDYEFAQKLTGEPKKDTDPSLENASKCPSCGSKIITHTFFDGTMRFKCPACSLQEAIPNKASSALAGLGGSYSSLSEIPSKSPTIAANKDPWAIKLQEMQDEVIKAYKEQWPNAKHLRLEFLKQKQSYLHSKLEQEKKDKAPVSVMGSYLSKYCDSKMIKSLKENTQLTNSGYIGAGLAKLVAANSEPQDKSLGPVSTFNQKFIQRIGAQSNCNVSIQGKSIAGYVGRRVRYRLLCDQCGAEHAIEDYKIVEESRYNEPGVLSFCESHKHLASDSVKVISATGRKFREDPAN